MPTVPVRQGSFAGGEIGSEIQGELRSEKRQTGVAEAKNCRITHGGTLEKRWGFRYVGVGTEVDEDGVDYSPRLVRWAGTGGEQDYCLHFHPRATSLYLRHPALPGGQVEPHDPYQAYISIIKARGGWVFSQTNDKTMTMVPDPGEETYTLTFGGEGVDGKDDYDRFRMFSEVCLL